MYVMKLFNYLEYIQTLDYKIYENVYSDFFDNGIALFAEENFSSNATDFIVDNFYEIILNASDFILDNFDRIYGKHLNIKKIKN